jgi:hypothetical protein
VHAQQHDEAGEAALPQAGRPALVGEQIPVHLQGIGVGRHDVGGHQRTVGQPYPLHPTAGRFDLHHAGAEVYAYAQVVAASQQRVGEGAQSAA